MFLSVDEAPGALRPARQERILLCALAVHPPGSLRRRTEGIFLTLIKRGELAMSFQTAFSELLLRRSSGCGRRLNLRLVSGRGRGCRRLFLVFTL